MILLPKQARKILHYCKEISDLPSATPAAAKAKLRMLTCLLQTAIPQEFDSYERYQRYCALYLQSIPRELLDAAYDLNHRDMVATLITTTP
jgi:hypothetical protein